VRLAYARRGDLSGVPVLLLHACGESLGCFDRLFPLLSPTIHVLAMDQRCHGHADKPASALTDFAADGPEVRGANEILQRQVCRANVSWPPKPELGMDRTSNGGGLIPVTRHLSELHHFF
jgi:rifampin ADP-ribosylating transferase